jgi:hypothetical protein
LNGNRRSAEAAFSSKQKIGEDGYIIVKAYCLPAIRTTGSGKHNGFSQRDPIDANIEKAADYQPEKSIYERFRIHAAILDYCI